MIQAGLLLVKATLIVSVALVVCRRMHRRRAAVRHAVIVAAFGILLALPIASVLGPSISLEMPIAPPRTTAQSLVPMAATAVDRLPADVDPAPVGFSDRPKAGVSTAFVMFVAWAIGVSLCLLPMLAGLWRMRSLRRSGRRWPLGERLVRDAAADAGIGRRMDVLLQEGIASPVTYGALRPAIALPPDAETWPKEELERAILHELEHVRRADWLTNCLARAICAAYWFHPLVWMAWRGLVLDAERACDDAVLRRAEPTAYADHLVVMAARRSSGPRRPMLAMAGHDDLSVRVRAILDSAQERGRAGAACIALTASTAIAAVAAVAPLQAVAVPRAASAMLVSALPADPVVVAVDVSEPVVTRETGTPLAVGRTSAKKRAYFLVRLKPDATSLKPDTTAILDGPNNESPAFAAAGDAQVAQADAAAVSRQMWILLFDVTSLQPDEMQAVAETARRWVAQDTSSADMVAIVTVGTRVTVVKEFTSSREELVAALQSPGLSEAAAGAGTLATSPIADTALEPFNDFRLRALATLCNTVAPIKQRKSLLYFSAGMNREADKDATELRAATNACMRANVLIYPVDARGLLSIPSPNPNGAGGALFRGR